MITHLVIPTKNRTVQLARAVKSYLDSVPGISIVIADESDSDDSRSLSSIDHGLSAVVYIGSRERADYLDKLSTASHVNRELLSWATTGLGGTRNLLQLLMAGTVYASADDDTVATFYSYPGYGGHTTRKPIRTDLHDPTTFHQGLGKVHPLDPRPALESLISHGASAAQCGIHGDSGMGGFTGQVTDRYERYRVHRTVRRHVDVPTLIAGGHFMTVMCAFDGTRTLPPFYPTGRGEDAIWSECIRLTGGLVGHAPLAVSHDPGDSDLRAKTPREHRPHDALWHWLWARRGERDDLAGIGRAYDSAGMAGKLGPFGEVLAVWERVTKAARSLPRGIPRDHDTAAR